MTRRRWAAAALVTTLALGTAACGSGGKGAASSDAASGGTGGTAAPVTLQLWDFTGMGLTPLIKQYEAAHPNVHVQEKTSELDPHHQALATALASGQGPDVAAVEASYAGRFFSNSSQWVDLRKYGADQFKADYVDWRWAMGVTPDSVVAALPTDVGGLAVCYRKDLFAKAGLPTDPQAVGALWPDWDSFIATGQRYVGATHAKFIDSAAGTIYNSVKQQGQQRYYDDKGTLVAASSPQVKIAFDDSTKAVEAGISANISQFSPQWNAAMNNGAFAVLSCPAWMMGYIQSQAPKTKGKWDIATLPGVAGNWGGSELGVTARSKHPAEAAALVEWLLAPEQQFALFKANGQFPSASVLYDKPELTGLTNPFFSDAPVGKIYLAAIKALKPIPLGRDERALDQDFANAIGLVEQKKASPDQAWQQALKSVQQDAGH